MRSEEEEAGSGEKARLVVGAARRGARRAEESRWVDGRNLAAAKAVQAAMAIGRGERDRCSSAAAGGNDDGGGGGGAARGEMRKGFGGWCDVVRWGGCAAQYVYVS